MRQFMARSVGMLGVLGMVCGGVQRSQALLYPGSPGGHTNVGAALDVDAYFSSEFVDDIESGPSTNHSAILPHVTVETFSEIDSHHYYKFTVSTAGYMGIFDIDYAESNGLDTQIALLASNQSTVLATNDDAPFDGPGDPLPSTLNSFLTYTFATPDVYYLQVGECVSNSCGNLSLPGEFAARESYTLHISIGNDPNPMPEPGTWLLFSTGLVGLLGYGWRRVKQQA